MRKLISFVIIAVLTSSCGVFKSEKKLKPRDGVVLYAKEYIGTPYSLGGNNTRGIDCSGLIHNAFKKQGVRVSRTVDLLRKEGKRISIDRAKPGDIIFLEPPKNENSPMQVLLLDVKEIFLFSFMPHLQGELSFLQ